MTTAALFRTQADLQSLSFITQPMHYYDRFDNTNYLFIVTDGDPRLNINGIVKYSLDKQDIVETHSYPSGFDDYTNRQAVMDTENHIIYVKYSSFSILSFDFKTKQWNTNYNKLDNFGNIVMIPSSINELHLTMDNMHFRWDQQTEEWLQLAQNIGTLTVEDDGGDSPGKFVFSKSLNRLFMFQARCDYLLCADMNTKEWSKHPTQLPQKMASNSEFSIILAWDQIIFMFGFDRDGGSINSDGNIWCLDLSHSDRWFKSAHQSPLVEYSYQFAVKDKENNAHLLVSSNSSKNKHFVVPLYELLPSEIIRLSTQKYDPLVIGYVKEWEKLKGNSHLIVPLYLKKLILKFYPLFV